MGIDLPIEILLDLKVFQDRFNDKITVCKPIQMVLEITGPYSRGIARMHQRGRVGLAHTLYSSCGNAITVSTLFGDDVEQDHFKTGIRGLCGDA